MFSSQTSSVLTIPNRAANVRFRAGSTQTEAYPLGSDGSKVSFEVTASGTRKYGFFEGLGAPAEVQYQIVVKQGERCRGGRAKISAGLGPIFPIILPRRDFRPTAP